MVTWDQVHAWRLRRHFLEPVSGGGAVEVARRLAGVQAQVASSAELSIALRQSSPREGEVTSALADRTLIKTWAMRGTLHLLPADEAAAYLEMSGAHRIWERGAWQRRYLATPADLEAMAEAATEALSGGAALTREELVAEIIERTGSGHLEEVLSSGWGMVLKPLAWWRVLCYGPPRDNRVTFVSASWLPPALGDVVVRAYLGAYGPTTPELFDKVWLSRGATKKKLVKSWFDELDLTTVDVEGTPMLILPEHADELGSTVATDVVRLLGAFDPYVLGVGTGTTQIVPAEQRAKVSRTAGWISPVVLRGGRVAGVWDDGSIDLWRDVPEAAIEAERARHAELFA